jgi:hypothetical protein
MQLFRFDAAVGRALDVFGSQALVMSRIGRVDGEVHMGCMHIGAGGIVGYHQAAVRQLFLVIAGTGWVRGTDTTRQPIAVGQAAYWAQGEWHEAGSQDGMTAIGIEAATLDPVRDMPAI